VARFRLDRNRVAQATRPARVPAVELHAALERGRTRAERHFDRYATTLEQVFREEAAVVARRFRESAISHGSVTAAAPTTASAMVAVYPTEEQAARLVQPNGEPAEILHVTLAFLGELDADEAERVAAVLQRLAPEMQRLEGEVGGIASFGSETGIQGEIARVAGLVAPEGGYGQTLWNPSESTVWWIPADWTSNDEADAAAQAFLAIPAVEQVYIDEAESAIPDDPAWMLVYANGPLVEPSHPSIVLPDVPGLAELRHEVVTALADAGIDHARNHGWTPHMTLAYTPTPSPPPVELLHEPLSFDRVYVTRGDLPRGYPLGQLSAAGEPPPWTPPHPDEVFNPERFMDRVRTKSDPVREQVLRDAMAQGLDLAGLNFDLTNPLVSAVYGRVASKVQNVTDTTRVGVMRTIGTAYDQGLSIPDTANLLQAALEGASRSRGELIARTEMTALVNGGDVAAARIVGDATGTEYLKRWLTAPGAEHPRHEDYDGLDGQTVGLDEPFDVGGESLMYPGDPAGSPEEICNCRCTCVMVDPVTEQDVGELDDEGEPEGGGLSLPSLDLGGDEADADALALADDAEGAALDEGLEVPDEMSAPTFDAPEALTVPRLSEQEVASSTTDDLWAKLGQYGQLENRARAEIANEPQQRLTAELWRRPETDLPEGTLRWNDVAGEGHFHTFSSDGHESLQQMAEEAIRRGESTMVVSDHAHLMTGESIAAQHREVDRLNRLYDGRFRILKGIEANILENGSLDLPDSVLQSFDRVNAGLHARPDFNTTERLSTAARNPLVSTIVHPHSVEADFDAVARAAAQGNTTLEINGRDLLRNETHERAARVIDAARANGVPLQLGADAHTSQDLVDARYAARFMAQHGVTRDDLAAWQRSPELDRRTPPAGDTVSASHGPFVSPSLVERIQQMGLDRDPPARGPVANQLLGRAADTQALYSNAAGEWTTERAALHDQLIAAHFDGKVPDPTGPKQAFFTSGGGASGKSAATFVDAEGREVTLDALDARRDVIYVDPDRIKEMLPEFVKLRDAGDAFAATAVHEESSLLSKEVIRQAIDRGYSVVIDSTASGSSFVGKLEAAAARGYDVQVTMVSIPTNEAITRSVLRGDQTGRYVVIPQLRKAHAGASANLALWKDEQTVGSWRVYDNSGANPELVAEGRGGSTTVYDQSRWQAILDKGDE
jgi:histidinol phosphatase-like PHP family hydrolase/2'-5' RNA ligase/predicted ABC-type ATPase